MRQDDTLYIVGESGVNVNNAITRMYGTFYVAFEVLPDTGEIVELDCSRTLDLTREFVRRLFIHKRLRQDSERIEEEVKRRYHGSSVEAIIASYRDALQRFVKIQETGASGK